MESEPPTTSADHLIDSQTVFAALRDTLATLYPEEQTARVVVDDAGLIATKITFSSRAQTNWHNILAEAIRQNRLDAVLQVVLAVYGNNPVLQAAYDQYCRLIDRGNRIDIPDQPTMDSGQTSSTETGGGTYIVGNITTSQGDVIGRDRIVHGDEVRRNKIEGVYIDSVAGGIHASTIAGRDVNSKYIFFFRDIWQVLVFLLFSLIIVVSIAYAFWSWSQPTRMTGDFNIAVAEFGQITNEGVKQSAIAGEIGTTLFNFLDSEFRLLDTGLEVQVTHRKLPRIVEDLDAERLAQQVNADVIIYGDMFIKGDDAEFLPRFYVANQPDTSEITGQSQLAHPISFKISTLSFENQINSEPVREQLYFSFSQRDWFI